MLDMFFGVMSAWNQGLLAFGGLIIFAIGAAILTDFLYVRIRGVRVKGEIAYVLVKGFKDIKRVSAASIDKGRKREKAKLTKEEKSAATIILLVPLIFITVGLGISFKYAQLKYMGLQAQGQIVDIERRTDSEGGTSKHAIVRFDTQDGKQYRTEDKANMTIVKFRTGDDVSVLYHPENPYRFVIDDWKHNLMMPAIIFGVGFFVLIVMYTQTPRLFGRSGKGPCMADFNKEMYTSVFRYQAPDGQDYEVPSDSSSNWLFSKDPGTKLTLLLKPYDYAAVRRPSLVFGSLGAVLTVIGLFMLYHAFIVAEVTKYTLLFAGAIFGFGAFKLFKKNEGKSMAQLKKEFSVRKKEKKRKKTGHQLTTDEFKLRLEVYKKGMWGTSLISLILAVSLCGGGFYWKQHNDAFRLTAERTQGQITNYTSSYSNSSERYMHYAMVEFKTLEGKMVKFRDKVGTSHPTKKEGTAVSVLYQPDDPHDARTARNTVEDFISAILMLIGALFFLYLIKTNIQIRRLARKYNIR